MQTVPALPATTTHMQGGPTDSTREGGTVRGEGAFGWITLDRVLRWLFTGPGSRPDGLDPRRVQGLAGSMIKKTLHNPPFLNQTQRISLVELSLNQVNPGSFPEAWTLDAGSNNFTLKTHFLRVPSSAQPVHMYHTSHTTHCTPPPCTRLTPHTRPCGSWLVHAGTE